MKKFVRVLCFALVAVMLCATLASCSKVSGAYSAEVDLWLTKGKATYDFGAFGSVTLTVTGELLGKSETKTYEGEYEIIENEDGTMKINFTFETENDDTKKYGGEHAFSIDEENNTITIGLITYKAVE
ncbi:MAG: hypothetical protein E7624_09265 [Ruminococcaceae bacterium]|nr:hypothetical protein [Oscillospiraceae bacterium]